MIGDDPNGPVETPANMPKATGLDLLTDATEVGIRSEMRHLVYRARNHAMSTHSASMAVEDQLKRGYWRFNVDQRRVENCVISFA